MKLHDKGGRKDAQNNNGHDDVLHDENKSVLLQPSDRVDRETIYRTKTAGCYVKSGILFLCE